jgi:Acyl carrier protein
MERNDVSLKIQKIMIESLELELLPGDIEGKNLGTELGINSVDALEILIRIEDVFGIQIDDEDLSAELFESLDILIDYVLKKLNSK